MHLSGDNSKVIARVKRLRGQLDGVERMLAEGRDCYEVLQSVAACRGALNGLTKELILAHLDHHVTRDPDSTPSIQAASGEIARIIESYFKG
jgi:DNA-binding FrmR family transcriptional regulator